MSKAVKTVAKIALPIAASFVLGPAGLGLTSAAVGGAIGGGIAGAVGGDGIKGAALGALGGYAAGGAFGTPAGTPLGATAGSVSSNAALQGPTMGSGVLGAVTGGGTRALTSTVTGAFTDPSKLLTLGANQMIADDSAEAAKTAANRMSDATNRAIAQQQPYTQLGQNAANQIQTIQADPTGYIKNNELYTSLANDAQSRLTAIQAAKGKLGSGETAAALQEKLLTLGTGLVNNQISNLQNQVNVGANAASNVGNSLTYQGEVQAAGTVGANNARVGGYENQLSTLLALQNAERANKYNPIQR